MKTSISYSSVFFKTAPGTREGSPVLSGAPGLWFNQDSEKECLVHLNDGSAAHAAADAQGSQTLMSATVLHSVQQGDQNTSAGSADRVTQSDCAAVDVQLVLIEAQSLADSDGLCCECLVGLDQIHIGNGHAGLGHDLLGSSDGAQTHDLGLNACQSTGDPGCQRLHAQLLSLLLAHDDQSSSAVVDGGRVTSGDDAVFGEGGLQLCQNLGSAQTGTLIGIEHGVALLALDDNRNDTDEGPRLTPVEKLATLKPAFTKDGIVTAGNSSAINDGAAALVVMSEEKAKELGVEPLATWVAGALAGVEPEVMGLGPIAATKKVMAKTGLTVADMDLIEANEAFAAQSVAVSQALNFDMSKVNVNGGAIALGHPVGASGARILVTLLYAMKHRGAHKGLATLCIGGGMGCATIVEMD